MEGSRNHPCTKNFAFYISHTFPCLIILSPIIITDFAFSLCFFAPCPGLLHGHLQSLGHPQHFSGHPHLGFNCSYNFLLNNLKAWSFVSYFPKNWEHFKFKVWFCIHNTNYLYRCNIESIEKKFNLVLLESQGQMKC